MKKSLFTMLALLFTGLLVAAPVENPWTPKKKKIIDMSWSNPSVDYLVENLARMEQEAPINGITVRFIGRKPGVEGKAGEVHAHAIITRDVWQYEWFADQIAKYKGLNFTRFTDNFIYTTMTPARDMDWFDDAYWAAICNNYGILARITRECGMTGIVFDPEEYGGQIWRRYPGHSHAEAIAKARQRGREFGRAVFGANPNIKLLCLFLFSNGTYLNGDQVNHTLSHSFFNGVYDVLPPTATMIEGHEYFGYFANTDAEFEQLRIDLDRTFLPRVAAENYNKYRTQTQLAAPIYPDEMVNPRHPCYNYLKPEIEQIPFLDYLRQNLQRALRVSDEYVWVYSETGCWWSRSPHPKVKGTWEEQFPGTNRIFIELANPDFLSAGAQNLVEVPTSGMGKWMFWTAINHQGRGIWQNGVAFMTGVKLRGSIHTSIPAIAGHEYMLTVEVRPRSQSISGSASLSASFRATNNAWMRAPGQEKVVQMRSRQRGEWETLTIRIVAPENCKLLYFQMGVAGLKDNDAVEFRNPRLIDLTATE